MTGHSFKKYPEPEINLVREERGKCGICETVKRVKVFDYQGKHEIKLCLDCATKILKEGLKHDKSI